MGQPTNWNDPEEIITAELEPEEELLWAGRPRLGLVVRATEIIPFGIILLIFGPSLVGLLQGVMNNRVGPAPFQLLFFGAPHLVFMTAYLFGRPIYDAWSRARCAYGVTSERVLFVSGLFGRRVRSLELDSMIDAKFAPSWRGSGGIIRFGSNAASSDSPFRQRTGFAQAAMEYFELDRDAPAVYRLVDGALQRQNRRRRKKGVMTAKASVDQPTVWENANELIEP
ncbi:MAG TPA: hypothetical protein VGZ47_15370, partial [Gemmataceae bacterium]|nr:hypothetical protein [Gemmataceae bacterium]